jgi:hyperosmotically inducible protein
MNPTSQHHEGKPPLKRDQRHQVQSKETEGSAKSETNANARKSSEQSLSQYTTDTMITGLLKAKLMADSMIPFNAISVETNDGIVKLTGYLESQQQMAQAEKIARAIKGVKVVENQLHLKS